MFLINKVRPLNRAAATLEIERLQRLAIDLTSIRDGCGPTEADLADAPFLVGWSRERRPAYCLVGHAFGHPRLTGAGQPIMTSDLWVLNEEQGWARTISRWYRLGQAASDTPAS
ncbi:DUF6634 family protein [Microvirga puerhi]|uniref:Uncharacterized protein n=1 Tax=Microvirga puerhi TaxID=2876078 RepID=A0ABS7VQR8_9HYPH|nr:DUF6634 family protein [Microvirga puerhi]MBZ6077362.1 hypothetical protein [Microvirga puerhi]